jgi:thiol:disulfide interchange protein DsbD
MRRRLACALGSAAAALALLANAGRTERPDRAEGALDRGEPRVAARLIAHPDDAGAPSVRLGLLLEMDPGWHVYWRHPGASGLATEVRLELERARVDALRWPAPARFFEPEAQLTTFGYEGRVLLFATARLEGEPREPRLARAEVDVLACKDRCIPAHFELSRTLGARASERESAQARDLFTDALSRLPRPPGPGDPSFRAERTRLADGSPRVTLTARGLRADARAQFFPDPDRGAALEPAGESRALPEGGGIALELRGAAAAAEAPLRVAGVLTLRTPAGDTRHLELSLPVTREDGDVPEPAATAPAAPSSGTGLLRAIGLAFLGGLVLNLMPCVLPVLAIKVFALVELAQLRRREALLHGLAYGAGIELSLLALAGAVVGLRAAGTQVGWGFQFQEPLFVLALAALVLAFALNLLGVFEIQARGGALARLGLQATGVRRSLFDGLLAVALATPCTAPFLGTAVGFALAGSGLRIALVFAAIGAGLALPFTAIALAPGLARWLPRPGAWMLVLRELLGFALLATAVWLLCVLERAHGIEALGPALALLWLIALACWACGRAQRAGRSVLPRAVAALAVVTVAAGSLALQAELQAPAAAGPESWRPFERAAIRAELDRGRPVFVDFTADWCLTCAANERLVLSQARVQQGFAEREVALFRADWTRRDETIGAELARFGRAGVPLYLVYHPAAPEQPIVLPELLSADLVLRALEPGSPGSSPAPGVPPVTADTSRQEERPIH